MAAHGLANKAIAERLFLSVRTVETPLQPSRLGRTGGGPGVNGRVRSMGESVIDRGAVEALVEDIGVEDVIELLDVYLDDAPQQLRSLHAALEARDVQGVASAAHRMKSTSAMMGATRLAEISQEVEERARAGDLSGTEGRASEIADLMADAREQLSAARARLEGER